jgi:hypothetical protein
MSQDTFQVIVGSLKIWFQGGIIPTVDELHLPRDMPIYQAYSDQYIIGWDQWFKGRIAASWKNVYNYDISRNIRNTFNHPRLTPANNFATKILVLTWEFVRDCWQFRNEDEHGTKADPIATQKMKLIRKFLWQKTKVAYFPNDYLRGLTEESL